MTTRPHAPAHGGAMLREGERGTELQLLRVLERRARKALCQDDGCSQCAAVRETLHALRLLRMP